MRVLAMYLPQFHRIPENDQWWGEGFTDWTAVRNAKPLYEGHDQPRVPLNDNYYDLLDKKTMKWQASLVHEYRVDGMCMYHYWFKDGRRLLEKPAENLLKWTDIDMPFCFCWANATWARTWAKFGRAANSWADMFEPDDKGEKKDNPTGILALQEYGNEDEWEQHFKYLLPFFKDERYIRIDDKPVFVIYDANHMACIRRMIGCWRKMAAENGLKGIYVIGGGTGYDVSDSVDGYYFRAPTDLWGMWKKYADRMHRSIPIPYKEVCDSILDAAPVFSKQPYFAGMTGFDSSPRNGEQGIIIDDANPADFEAFLVRLLNKNRAYGSDITFINAWNEWGEGMYLEPDTKDGYAYLEAVKRAKELFEHESEDGFEDVRSHELKLLMCSYEKNNAGYRRADANVDALNKWMGLIEDGIDITEIIGSECKGSLAIYGYGVLGRRLCRLLIKRGIGISYIIDKNPNIQMEEGLVKSGCKVVRSVDDMPSIDNVIITTAYDHRTVAYELERVNKTGNIVSLRDLINRGIENSDKY